MSSAVSLFNWSKDGNEIKKMQKDAMNLTERIEKKQKENKDFKNMFRIVMQGWTNSNTPNKKIRKFLKKYPNDVDYICDLFQFYRVHVNGKRTKPTPKYLASILLEFGADPDIILWGQNVTLFHDFMIDAYSDTDSNPNQPRDIKHILTLGPTIDLTNSWGNSVLHIVGMMLSHVKHKRNETVLQNFIDLINYGYNPYIDDQFFCRGANALTCIREGAPEIYSKLQNYIDGHEERKQQMLCMVSTIMREHYNLKHVPPEICILILDFAMLSKFYTHHEKIETLSDRIRLVFHHAGDEEENDT